MKNIKKITALLIALLMIFALCACGDDTNDTEEGGNNSDVSVSSKSTESESSKPTQDDPSSGGDPSQDKGWGGIDWN